MTKTVHIQVLVAVLLLSSPVRLLIAEPIEIVAVRIEAPPIVDGVSTDPTWLAISPVSVTVQKTVDGRLVKHQVHLRAVHDGERLHLLAQWDDSTGDTGHHTRVWDEKRSRYVDAGDREDGLAISWAMGDDFSACMLAGIAYQADLWHWMACRTNPARVAADGRLIMSTKRQSDMTNQWKTKRGTVYIDKLDDGGDGPFSKQATPKQFEGPRLARYRTQPPTGSQADVHAQGRHDGSRWTLELARRLDTKHPDDLTMVVGGIYPFAIAVFDRETDEDHRTSGPLQLRIAE